jgi:hypothetical protein
MMTGVAPRPDPAPRRARPLIPAALPRRRELIAALAVAVVLLHLLLAQLTLILLLVFIAVSRTTRWRAWWLLVPAAAGTIWILATGPGPALSGFTAGPAVLLAHLRGARPGPGSPGGGPGGPGRWLPRQFPVALLLAAAETAAAGWLRWRHTDEWALPEPRPGAVAALRALVTARAVRAGAVLTRDGCALGLIPATGAGAGLRWDEIARGLLVAGASEQEVALTALQVVHAALRRRKPVIVLDAGPGPAVARALAAACQATQTPLRAGQPAGPPRTQPADRRLVVQGAASASQLWGRASAAPHPAPERPALPDLDQVISERTAALLPADSAESAAAACAALAALAADLRRIGVDGDALIWVPQAERLPAAALAALLRDGAPAGLTVLAATTDPAAAAELAGTAGALLVRRVADPALAAALAGRTGARLLPPAVAAARNGEPPPLDPPGVPAGLVRCPAVPARNLLTLGPADFVLAVSAPQRRLVPLGRLVPARLPRPGTAA